MMSAEKLLSSTATPCLMSSKTVEDSKQKDIKLCECDWTGKGKHLCHCGCKTQTTIYRGKPRLFIVGHHTHLRNAETIYNWKGDNAGYKSIHIWLRKHIPRPDICEICNKRPTKELANMTGIYNRDPTNYQWMCVSCHRNFDGIGFEEGNKAGLGYKHPEEWKRNLANRRDPKTGRFVNK